MKRCKVYGSVVCILVEATGLLVTDTQYRYPLARAMYVVFHQSWCGEGISELFVGPRDHVSVDLLLVY